MKWPFVKQKAERDARVTALDEEARANEISLVERILELDRKRVDLNNQLAEDALRDLHGARRV